MNDKTYTLLYCLVLGLVCAGLLTGVGQALKPFREANEKAELYGSVLRVLGVPTGEHPSPQELVDLFEGNVKVAQVDGRRTFEYVDKDHEGKVLATAVDLSGNGLWGPIKGLLAFEPDMTTIRGLAIYHQEETPGLGGEIGTPMFLDQFKGKQIAGPTGGPGLRILKGKKATAVNEIDGITGATLTCGKMQTILNDTIKDLPKGQVTDGR